MDLKPASIRGIVPDPYGYDPRKTPATTAMFPKIIREFDDGQDEKPMIYGRKRRTLLS